MRVGVLALQGDFREHLEMLRQCGVEAVEVRRAELLDAVDALVIPGGESTAIGKLMDLYGFFPAVRRRAREGMAIFGTCAGLVLLAREALGAAELEGKPQPLLGLMDMVVRRNGFGRQRESFEADLAVPDLGAEPVRAVFIRAPYVESTGPGVRVMAAIDGKPVLVREGRCLAAAFHPELTADLRLHRYFLERVAGAHGR